MALSKLSLLFASKGTLAPPVFIVTLLLGWLSMLFGVSNLSCNVYVEFPAVETSCQTIPCRGVQNFRINITPLSQAKRPTNSLTNIREISANCRFAPTLWCILVIAVSLFSSFSAVLSAIWNSYPDIILLESCKSFQVCLLL